MSKMKIYGIILGVMTGFTWGLIILTLLKYLLY